MYYNNPQTVDKSQDTIVLMTNGPTAAWRKLILQLD